MNTSFRYTSSAPVALNPLSRKGMVSTPHYLASQAGLEALKKGGTAVDAAIAATAVLSVVYPHMCGLGGDSFWLIYDAAAGELKALNASGRAAAAARPTFFTEQGHSTMPMRGPLAACTVPGAVSGWAAAHELSRTAMHSPLSWAELLDAAQGHAQDGFAVGHSLARWLDVDSRGSAQGDGYRALQLRRAFAEIFCNEEGRGWKLGHDLHQPALARTLQRLAQNGPAEFYEGETAEAIVHTLQEQGGLLCAADLARHRADWQQPISVPYRHDTVWSTPPNSQGMTALQILHICHQINLSVMPEGGADYYHFMAEAVRLALADRDANLTDLASPHLDMDRVDYLLSRRHALELLEQISLQRVGGPLLHSQPGGDTVWVGAVDAAGNAVSMLQSLYHEFGSGVVAQGTGVLLQNRACAFSLDPSHINCIAPGKRSLHTLTPAMIFKNKKPWLVYGSMGGDGQPQTLAALTSRIVDYELSPQDAINAPRWLLGRSWGAPDADLKLEGRVPPEVVAELEKRGHTVRVVQDYTEIMGHAGAILCHEDGLLQGAADPRGDGLALAL